MIDAISISTAKADDLADILRLYTQLHPEDPLVGSKQALSTWSEILEARGRTVLLARHGPSVVGTVEYSVWSNLTRGARPFIMVENLVVEEPYRHMGVGRRLLTAVKSCTENLKPYKIQLAVADDGPIGFYESCGYRTTGRVMKYLQLGGDCETQ